ncbi:MAG: amidohydrolase family protein [Candidatus Omnitrophica bacterium]|nr:amidohydrolase family protein [Candidatus Omnitrophota bacterium]MBD3269375.1 amidohydrolase family protein [Candidatus Omnitrophota bacterium]
MICDSHTHFIPEAICERSNFYKGIWHDRESYFSFLDSNYIEKALLVYPSTDAGRKLKSSGEEADIYNREIGLFLKSSPRIVAACLPDLDNIGNCADKLARLKEKGFRAINLASSLKGRFLIKELVPLFEAAQRLDLPIFVHPQTMNPLGFERVKDPLLMPVLEYTFDESMFLGLLMTEEILQNFKIKFIFSSLGGVTPFLKERFDRVYLMLKQRGIVKDLHGLPSEIFKRVFVDTSGASLSAVKMAIDLFGPDHVLWGSDYPVHPCLEKNIASFDTLGKEVKEKLIHSNFKNIFPD